MKSGPFFRKRETAVAVGILLFVGGWAALYDAFERRGVNTPRILRPFTWW
jgi:hypothetical protein